ncbi:hypothetical protein RAS1_16140 [Phycisphaerae bacterium RAS1]|nr:hypothetical protein RAS1_16140 [Phycisphaerae bacterium RAS1]
MPTNPRFFDAFRRVAALCAVAGGVAALLACGYGLYQLGAGHVSIGLAYGAGGLAAFVVTLLVYFQVLLAHKVTTTAFRAYDTLLESAESIRRSEAHLRTIADNSTLSDWAKRIIYREKDYEFLRDTIRGAIVRQDWEAADHLIADLQESFGYREEAAQLRSEVERARAATADERVAGALQRFEGLCDMQKWEQARREADHLRSLFPDDARIRSLPGELELRRNRLKRELLTAYSEAVRTENVDRAHKLLVQLDEFLSPNEAAALKESARGVFKAKLLQMGVQFSLAVTERDYARAIDTGRRIVREFPNSRYAREIGDMLPTLEQRAAGHAPIVLGSVNS